MKADYAPFIGYVSLHRWFGDKEMKGFLAAVPRWVELGATMIGGCCRVGPQEIQLIKQLVDSLHKT